MVQTANVQDTDEWDLPGCPITPPCSSLLEDAEAVLADQSRWPDHLCLDVARVSVLKWASVTAPGAGLVLRKWRTFWPLPIGRAALAEDNALWYGPAGLAREHSPQRVVEVVSDLAQWLDQDVRDLLVLAVKPGLSLEHALSWLPFRGTERALFAASVASERLDLLGLASPTAPTIVGMTPDLLRSRSNPEWVPTPEWLQAGPLASVHRSDGTSSGRTAAALLTAAQRWWAKSIQGRPLRGRPPGLTYPTLNEYLTAIDRAHAKAKAQGWDLQDRHRFKPKQLAQLLHLSPRAMYDHNKEHGLTVANVRRRTPE